MEERMDTTVAERRREDPWRHRSQKMRCRTCMFFVMKIKEGLSAPATYAVDLGRCRRRAPVVNYGWPAVYDDDWCGDHKMDENKA